MDGSWLWLMGLSAGVAVCLVLQVLLLGGALLLFWKVSIIQATLHDLQKEQERLRDQVAVQKRRSASQRKDLDEVDEVLTHLCMAAGLDRPGTNNRAVVEKKGESDG